MDMAYKLYEVTMKNGTVKRHRAFAYQFFDNGAVAFYGNGLLAAYGPGEWKELKVHDLKEEETE